MRGMPSVSADSPAIFGAPELETVMPGHGHDLGHPWCLNVREQPPRFMVNSLHVIFSTDVPIGGVRIEIRIGASKFVAVHSKLPQKTIHFRKVEIKRSNAMRLPSQIFEMKVDLSFQRSAGS